MHLGQTVPRTMGHNTQVAVLHPVLSASSSPPSHHTVDNSSQRTTYNDRSSKHISDTASHGAKIRRFSLRARKRKGRELAVVDGDDDHDYKVEDLKGPEPKWIGN